MADHKKYLRRLENQLYEQQTEIIEANKKEEISALIVKCDIYTVFNLMRIDHDIALFGLSEYLAQFHTGKAFRSYQIMKYLSRSNTRKLVYIPDQYESDSYRDRF